MKIEDLYKSENSPLDAPQRGDIEREHTLLMEDIEALRLQSFELREEVRKVKELCESRTRDAAGCIDALGAMLRCLYNRCGSLSTEDHSFLAAIIEYVEEVRKSVRPYFSDEPQLPF